MNTLRLAILDEAIDRTATRRLVDRLETSLGDRRVTLVGVESDWECMEEFEHLASALSTNMADVAFCPASKLPLTLPEGVVIGAFLRTHPPEYRCASRRPPSLGLLPSNSKVLSCDSVSRAQILHRYPWLFVEAGPLSPEARDSAGREVWDAACIPPEIADAATFSGMRLESVSADIVIPAVGQGIACLVVRAGNPILAVVRELNQPSVEASLGAEREFVRRVSGVGEDAVRTARATLDGGRCRVIGMVAQRDGAWLVDDRAEGPGVFARTLALEIAESCAQLAHKARRVVEVPTAPSRPPEALAGSGR
jgi:porphobilinogen deaminase